jgi:hypothetical protein
LPRLGFLIDFAAVLAKLYSAAVLFDVDFGDVKGHAKRAIEVAVERS